MAAFKDESYIYQLVAINGHHSSELRFSSKEKVYKPVIEKQFRRIKRQLNVIRARVLKCSIEKVFSIIHC